MEPKQPECSLRALGSPAYALLSRTVHSAPFFSVSRVPLLAPRSRAASKPALHLNTRLVSPAPVGVDKSLSKSEISARASLSARLAYGRSDTARLQSTHSAATRHASLGDLHTSCGLSAAPYAIHPSPFASAFRAFRCCAAPRCDLPVGLRSHCRPLRRRVAPKPVARRGSDDSTPIKARVRDPRLCAPLPWPTGSGVAGS